MSSSSRFWMSAIMLWGLQISFLTSAQNALDFDGVNDYVDAPNASALVANSTTISMSMWVYPKSNSSGYPDFDGYAGIRNEVNADFYILQLNSNNIEARFRNSSGTPYTISANNLVTLNSWNHLVLTYDGTNLRLYHNGSLVSSIPASGSFSATTLPFNVGYVPFSANNFYLWGKLDDVALWKRTLSATEVTALYNSCGVNLSDPDLKLCYEFNQGTAGGNNTTINSLTDSKGNINGVFNNLALSGSFSNFVTGIQGRTSSNLTVNSCGPYTVPSGNATYGSSGTVYDTLANSLGCDSLIIIQLTVDSVDLRVNQQGDTLTALATGVGYNWINCDTKQPIPGANGKMFIPTQTGNYAVIISKSTCNDTSDCYQVVISGVGIDESELESIRIFPNPVEDEIGIEIPDELGEIEIEISDLTGKVILSIRTERSIILSLPDGLNPGPYILRLSSAKATSVRKILKF